MIETTITAGGLVALILEGLKYIFRKWIIKNDSFDFPANFYVVAIPVGNILVVPLCALLLIEGYHMPSDWQAWLTLVLQTLIASLISVIGYQGSIKSLKTYSKELKKG